ncbi:MAG: glycosyltransferase family 8 protein, partial [Lachnospiraceae bacterium oral taxon 082]|nr:glycosyltransferase family 8 protein [Lachnospiraceae bacterium oral taxon 082]
MNIVYIANEKFAMHLGVSLYSLYERNRHEKELRVFIISTGIGGDSLGNLKSIAKKFGRTVEIIELKDTSKYFDTGLQDASFDISKMGRLLVGELLPEDVERVLYLDCDMVILHSIRELYDTKLGKNVVAAVEEPTVLERVRYEIRLDYEASYVNAGLLLIDLKKWREENLGEKIISYSKSIWDKSLFGEQDAIN